MIWTSEWVSPGHPDKTADYISCYILDRFLERDPKARFAVEVMLKDAAMPGGAVQPIVVEIKNDDGSVA